MQTITVKEKSIGPFFGIDIQRRMEDFDPFHLINRPEIVFPKEKGLLPGSQIEFHLSDETRYTRTKIELTYTFDIVDYDDISVILKLSSTAVAPYK